MWDNIKVEWWIWWDFQSKSLKNSNNIDKSINITQLNEIKEEIKKENRFWSWVAGLISWIIWWIISWIIVFYITIK